MGGVEGDSSGKQENAGRCLEGEEVGQGEGCYDAGPGSGQDGALVGTRVIGAQSESSQVH